jgi:SNF2 family DNA or RNA helicase
MGLGKTVVTIAAVEELIDAGEIGGGLVIVPASLKYQWEAKIAEFTDSRANTLVIDGDERDRLRSYHKIKEGKVEYAILNYEQVVNDWAYVKNLPRDFICLDEAQAIKSPVSKRGRKIRQMKAHYKWGLTGQPVENRAEEVFHIMEWIDPSVLGPADVFDRTFIVRDGYGKVKRYRNLPLLHKALSRAMVRKTWADPDVASQMPQVSEESIIVPFDRAAAKAYQEIANELLGVLEETKYMGGWNVLDHYNGESAGITAAGEVMSRVTCLRMLCDHPELLRLSARLRRGEATEDDLLWGGSATGSAYAAELEARGILDRLRAAPKLTATIEVVDDIMLADPKNKVVIFSFFKGAIAVLEEKLRKYGVALFHGGISAKAREAEKQRFLTDPNCRIFLSSDAGGVGVDLPVANYLISYDLPWSAGAWKQRNARIIRLSSEWPRVTLISMLMAGSIEERQYDALQQKQRIADAITDGRGADAKGDLRLNLDTLTEFLRNSSPIAA